MAPCSSHLASLTSLIWDTVKIETRQVYIGSCEVKFIEAIFSVYQYYLIKKLSKRHFGVKDIFLGKTFFVQKKYLKQRTIWSSKVRKYQYINMSEKFCGQK